MPDKQKKRKRVKLIAVLAAVVVAFMIFFSFVALETDFGAYSLAFGFAVVTTVIISRILEKW